MVGGGLPTVGFFFFLQSLTENLQLLIPPVEGITEGGPQEICNLCSAQEASKGGKHI